MDINKLAQPSASRSLLPNLWDAIAIVLVIGALVLLAYGARVTNVPMTALDLAPVTLDPANLPEYALRTILRMLLAIVFSLLFTFAMPPWPRKAAGPRSC